MERALRIATWLAAALLGGGLLLWLAGSGLAPGALHAGLWLLISTPVVRVVMALADYAREGDWTFAVLTLIVLGCLVFPIARYMLSLPR